jgi:hypothetical protein
MRHGIVSAVFWIDLLFLLSDRVFPRRYRPNIVQAMLGRNNQFCSRDEYLRELRRGHLRCDSWGHCLLVMCRRNYIGFRIEFVLELRRRNLCVGGSFVVVRVVHTGLLPSFHEHRLRR